MKKLKQKPNGVPRAAQYKTTFLKPTEFMARNGKTVYISEESHQKISRIVLRLEMEKSQFPITCIIYWSNIFRILERM
jgi:predicted ATP-dependent serine protease